MSFEDAFREFPRLEAERLVLRELVPEDAEALRYHAVTLKDLRFPGPELYTIEDAQEQISACRHNYESRQRIEWGIARKEDDMLIGMCSLSHFLWRSRAEIGYWLSKEHWGKGLTTEAVKAAIEYGFGTMELHRIHATSNPDNIASIKVLKKAGMQEEGLLREYSDNKSRSSNRLWWTDAIMFSILRSENQK